MTITINNRRSFLKLLSGGAISSCLGLSISSCTHKKFFNPDEDIFLSGGSYKKDNNIQNALIAINLYQQEKRVVDNDFMPHATITNPKDKYQVYCFEKNGVNASIINLQSKTVFQKFNSKENHQFSGHAAFSADGKTLYCIENSTNNKQGLITVRNSKTLDIEKQLPTLGLAAHDCKVVGNTIIVSNTEKSESGFHQPSLVYIDLTTEKLIKRIKLDDHKLNCGHFYESDAGDTVIASASLSQDDSLGGVSFVKKDSKAITMKEPKAVIKRMTGEALSLAINQKQNIAAITHPDANLLTFWSTTNNSIIRAYGIEKPRGLSQTLDKKHFVISYGNKAAMAKISSTDLTPLADSIVKPTLATGEHLINWSANLRKIMPKRIYD